MWAWAFVLASGGVSAAALTLMDHRISPSEAGAEPFSAQLVVWNSLPVMALALAVGRATRPAQILGAGIFVAAAAVYAALDTAIFPSVFGSAVLYLVPLYQVFLLVPLGFACGAVVGLLRDEVIKRQRQRGAA